MATERLGDLRNRLGSPPDDPAMIVRWRVAGVELVGVLDVELGWRWGTRGWSWPWVRVVGEG